MAAFTSSSGKTWRIFHADNGKQFHLREEIIERILVPLTADSFFIPPTGIAHMFFFRTRFER